MEKCYFKCVKKASCLDVELPAELFNENEKVIINRHENDFDNYSMIYVMKVKKKNLTSELGNDTISIPTNIYKSFFEQSNVTNSGMTNENVQNFYSISKVNDVRMPKAFCADLVEVTICQHFVSRSDMYRLVQFQLRDSFVRVNLSSMFDGLYFTITEIWSENVNVSLGYVDEETNIVFRCQTEAYQIFIQMSAEMWQVDTNSNLVMETTADGFFHDLFQLWKNEKCSHYVTMALFSRIFFDATHIDEFPLNKVSEVQELNVLENGNRRKRLFYQDHYYVLYENCRFDDWLPKVIDLKRHMMTYKEHMQQELEGMPSWRISYAMEGNFLETLNIALNTFELQSVDRMFNRTGNLSVVVTPGCGVFKYIDRDLNRITRQRYIDMGVGADLVCIGEQPLHAVPLFILKESIRSSNHQIFLQSTSMTNINAPNTCGRNDSLEKGFFQTDGIDLFKWNNHKNDNHCDQISKKCPYLNGTKSKIFDGMNDLEMLDTTSGMNFTVPHWCNLSFYTKDSTYRRCVRTFIPRIKIHQRSIHIDESSHQLINQYISSIENSINDENYDSSHRTKGNDMESDQKFDHSTMELKRKQISFELDERISRTNSVDMKHLKLPPMPSFGTKMKIERKSSFFKHRKNTEFNINFDREICRIPMEDMRNHHNTTSSVIDYSSINSKSRSLTSLLKPKIDNYLYDINEYQFLNCPTIRQLEVKKNRNNNCQLIIHPVQDGRPNKKSSRALSGHEGVFPLHNDNFEQSFSFDGEDEIFGHFNYHQLSREERRERLPHFKKLLELANGDKTSKYRNINYCPFLTENLRNSTTDEMKKLYDKLLNRYLVDEKSSVSSSSARSYDIYMRRNDFDFLRNIGRRLPQPYPKQRCPCQRRKCISESERFVPVKYEDEDGAEIPEKVEKRPDLENKLKTFTRYPERRNSTQLLTTVSNSTNSSSISSENSFGLKPVNDSSSYGTYQRTSSSNVMPSSSSIRSSSSSSSTSCPDGKTIINQSPIVPSDLDERKIFNIPSFALERRTNTVTFDSSKNRIYNITSFNLHDSRRGESKKKNSICPIIFNINRTGLKRLRGIRSVPPTCQFDYLYENRRPLINPFKTPTIALRVTSNRRRWVHAFPQLSNGALFLRHIERSHQRHTSPSTNDYATSQRCQQLKLEQDNHITPGILTKPVKDLGEPVRHCIDIPETERSKLSVESAMDIDLVKIKLKDLRQKRHYADSFTIDAINEDTSSVHWLFGPTGKEDWEPLDNTGVDWKSLVFAACLPLTTDYIPVHFTRCNIEEYDIVEHYYSIESLLEEAMTANTDFRREDIDYSRLVQLVFIEMICQRLQFGYQIVSQTSENKSDYVKIRMFAQSSKHFALLSMGEVIHSLDVIEKNNSHEIRFRSMKPRPKIYNGKYETRQSIIYRYRLRSYHHNDWDNSICQFSLTSQNIDDWRHMDESICLQGYSVDSRCYLPKPLTMTLNIENFHDNRLCNLNTMYYRAKFAFIPTILYGGKFRNIDSNECESIEESDKERIEEAELNSFFIDINRIVEEGKKKEEYFAFLSLVEQICPSEDFHEFLSDSIKLYQSEQLQQSGTHKKRIINLLYLINNLSECVESIQEIIVLWKDGCDETIYHSLEHISWMIEKERETKPFLKYQSDNRRKGCLDPCNRNVKFPRHTFASVVLIDLLMKDEIVDPTISKTYWIDIFNSLLNRGIVSHVVPGKNHTKFQYGFHLYFFNYPKRSRGNSGGSISNLNLVHRNTKIPEDAFVEMTFVDNDLQHISAKHVKYCYVHVEVQNTLADLFPSSYQQNKLKTSQTPSKLKGKRNMEEFFSTSSSCSSSCFKDLKSPNFDPTKILERIDPFQIRPFQQFDEDEKTNQLKSSDRYRHSSATHSRFSKNEYNRKQISDMLPVTIERNGKEGNQHRSDYVRTTSTNTDDLSMRIEWALFCHLKSYDPKCIVEFELQWYVCNGIKIWKKCQDWQRNLLGAYRLIQIPINPFTKDLDSYADPLRRSIEVYLNTENFKRIPNKELRHRIYDSFQKWILSAFAFIPNTYGGIDVKTPDFQRYYLHESGEVCVSIEYRLFNWAWNHLSLTGKYCESSMKMYETFVKFCSDTDQTMSNIFNEYL
ncbi:hypothetical protein SNEBB_009563 [Seison nebaliae]|nr:hypothetical protein SNEBB_009563 [Seison nebaliae]